MLVPNATLLVIPQLYAKPPVEVDRLEQVGTNQIMVSASRQMFRYCKFRIRLLRQP